MYWSDVAEHMKYFLFLVDGSSKDSSFAGGASIEEDAALFETNRESFITDKPSICLHL